MSLSQRPAARFYAAFYRLNTYNQRQRPCAIASQCARSNMQSCSRICVSRNYHATHQLRQQSQLESHVQDDAGSTVGENVPHISGRGGERILRPVKQEEVATTQPDATEPDETSELSETDVAVEKLKSSVRGFMRNVPSSVAVLTVASKDPETSADVPMGVAVSSLSTVTLDPPTVSFNIKEPSKTLDAIRAANGRFRVHFPAANRQGAKVVELFCRGNHPDAYDLRTKELKLHLPKDKKHPATPLSFAPQILNDYILGAMECTLTHQLPVADHVILVARIESLECKTSKEPTILYLNGGYKQPKEDNLQLYGRTKLLSVRDHVWSFWDYPLFPGAKERMDYLEQIKTFIKGDPARYENPSRELYRSIESSLPYPASNFGISLELLVAECRQEMGLKHELKADLKGQQVLSDFYGILTPSMRNKIVERAKKLVAMDSMFLSQGYKVFLHNLGVSAASRDFLPSDIMGPLRTAGLAPPFEPRRGHSQSFTYDIQRVEQVEFHLREHFRKMKYAAAVKEPLENAMEAIGEHKLAALFFKKTRSRLLTQSHPGVFGSEVLDISGEVTQEELRVVLCRIINRLHVRSQAHFRSNVLIDWCESLRRVGVNPTISGMDVEFLMGKIKHLYYTTRQYHDFPQALNDMLQPFFLWNISWDDLEERARQFVQKIPLRATAWSSKDRLAAMGLHWEATVTLPTQDALEKATKQPLLGGRILDTLVAKELKNHYGKGTEEENEGIAKYLKEEYSFDVTHKPITYTPAASPSQSSSDEMQEAMLASLTISKEKMWSEKSKPRSEWKTYKFD